jgi:hypothetical protein
MSQQTINIGHSANDKSGDPLRSAFNKVNANFTELYALTGGSSAALIELAQDYAAPLFTHASHTNITVTYDDANNKILLTGAAAQVQSNWTASSGLGVILNKPTLFSGSYTDLTNKPSIPSAYTLPTASASILGGIKIGSGLSIDGSGVVTASSGSVSSLVNGGSTLSLASTGVLTLPNSGELRPSTAAYDSALAGWESIRGGEIAGRIANGQALVQYYPMVNWYPTGTTAQGYIDFLLNAWTLQNTPGATLIIQPAMTSSFYAQLRAALIAIRDSYNTSTKSVSLSSAYGQSWNFGATGSLTLPAPAPITFTANLVPVYHAGGGGNAWYYTVIFQPNVNGDVVTMISGAGRVWDHNPGYQSDDSWTFTQADHGIPGYTFTLILGSVDNLGGGEWTAQLAVTQGPEYPSTIKSTATIKLSADTKNWTFGTDGKLLLPGGNAQIVVEDNGVRIGTGNLSTAPSSHIRIGGADHAFEIFGGPPGYSWKFDATGNLTFPNNSKFDGQTLTDHATGVNYTLKIANGGEAGSVFGIGTGDATYGIANDALNHAENGYVPYTLTAQLINLTVPGGGSWVFDNTGSLTFPNATVQTTAWPGSVSSLVSGAKTVSLGSTGTLTLANGTTISDQQVNLTKGPALNSFGSNSYTGTFTTLNYTGLDTTWVVNGPGVVNGVIQSIDAAGYTIILQRNTGGPQFQNGQSYTFTGPSVSVGSKITVNSNNWVFGTDGSLTLPDASVIASYKPVTVIAQSTSTRTITNNASAAFIQFVDTVDTANSYSADTFTVPYTGYYQVNLSIYFSTSVTLSSGSLFIDTNLDNAKVVTIFNGAWSGSYLHYSTVIPATMGDSVRIAIRQVSGASIDLASGCRLTIHRVSIS